MKKVKVGLALGSGAAKGLAHIGVLKTLHKHKIYPDYIAGTSMGAVIGALYCVGYTPEKIEEITKTTEWKNIIDFDIPKAGLIRGRLVENKIRRLLKDKKFSDLNTSLKIVSYNFDKKEKVVFSKGNVAKAVRASISIPGLFAPIKIGKYRYIDGVVTDPTPFDVVRNMGADVVIAVDLYKEEKVESGPIVKDQGLLNELREKFLIQELLNVKNYILPERWPAFITKILEKVYDALVTPARVIRILAGKELPEITKVMYGTINILSNNLAKERINCSNVEIKVTPSFGKLSAFDFNRVDSFVKIGEKAMQKEMEVLRKYLK